MTISFSTSRALAVALLSSAALSVASLPASAQGTPEQREACAPDAIRLCQDTIPDIGRTTACMRAHRAALSPACKIAFDAGAPAPASRPKVAQAPKSRMAQKVAREPKPAPAVAVAARPSRPVVAGASVHRAAPLRGSRDTREARQVMGRLCGSKVIDADTCGFVDRMITLSE